MPPRPPLPQNAFRTFHSSSVDLFFCRSCSLWRVSSRKPPTDRKPHTLRRPPQTHLRLQHTSTLNAQSKDSVSSKVSSTSSNDYIPQLASRTAINAPINIPARHRPLYDALEKLKSDAGSYVNLSRLQLALRGLERGEMVVRIAVLGLGEDGMKRAKSLVRLLFADPLTEEAWENKLDRIGEGEENGKGLLIRYGEESEVALHNSLLATLPVPSQLLQRHNIELLISSLNINLDGPAKPADAVEAKEVILVPRIQLPISSTGRSGIVTYPVHCALMVGQGIEDVVAWGRYNGTYAESLGEKAVQEDGLEPMQDAIKVAFDMPGATATLQLQDQSRTATGLEPAIIDVNEGTVALAKFRESISNSVAYEHGWLQSNLGTLRDWILRAAPTVEDQNATNQDKIHPALRTLITNLLTDASTRLDLSEATQLQSLTVSVLPEGKRADLHASLATWSESAHRELQTSLERAFTSRAWHKLRWYKLFWRVDDVQAMTNHLLMKHWLPVTQDNSYILIGRMVEAGLLTEEDLLSQATRRQTQTEIAVPDGKVQDEESLAPQLHAIEQTRAKLLDELSPELQIKAQTYVLNSLGTLSLTTAFSALVYVWSLGPTLEASAPGFFSGTWAGAIFSGGVVFALARLQRRWEKAVMEWEGQVREEGRRAIKSLEDAAAWRIREGGRGQVEEAEDVKERREARWAVERCRENLEEVEK